MRKIPIIIFLLCGQFAHAQISYRIDAIQGGGFYLVEIVPGKTGDPSAQPAEFPQKFSDEAQLVAYVEYLRKQAADLREQAKKSLDRAPQVEQAAAGIEQTGKAFFAPKPPVVIMPEPEPEKPKPSPKKKRKKNK